MMTKAHSTAPLSKACPICNFELKANEESLEHGAYQVNCHDCGQFTIKKECAEGFRRKYLSFDVSTIGGRDMYEHNIKLLRSHLARHHKEVLTDDVIHKQMPGLYMPRQ
jgi:hypothetical protein